MQNPSRVRQILEIHGESPTSTVKLRNLWNLLLETSVNYQGFVKEVIRDLLHQRSSLVKVDLSGLSSAHVSRAVFSIALSFPELIGQIFETFEHEVRVLGPGLGRGSDNAIVGTLNALLSLEEEDYFVSYFTRHQQSRQDFERRVIELLEKGIREGWFAQVSITKESSGQLSNALGGFVRKAKNLLENPLRHVYRMNHLIELNHMFYRLDEEGLLPLESLNTVARVVVDEVGIKVFANTPRWARLRALRQLPTYNPQL